MAKHTSARKHKIHHKKKSNQQKYREKEPNKYQNQKAKPMVTPIEARY
jgi:hypothetical protein